MERYFGTYQRFDTLSKKDATLLIGADCVVGEAFEIFFKTENGKRIAWMKNRFGAEVGFFDEDFSRKLSLCEAKGFVMKALFALVAYNDLPSPGFYWGEAAVMCYDPRLAEPFETFIAGIGERLGNGVRPDISFGEQGVDQIIQSNGTWQPTQTVPMPEKQAGMAVLKARKKVSEGLIEQGRQGNKGCYAVSWLFIILLVVLAAFGLHWLGLF